MTKSAKHKIFSFVFFATEPQTARFTRQGKHYLGWFGVAKVTLSMDWGDIPALFW